jgi:hypothetical protein
MTTALGIEYVKSNDEYKFKENWDFVFIPSQYIPPEKFPNAKLIIYGPHNFVFPNGVWTSINMKNNGKVYYNSLSRWVSELYQEVSQFEKNFNMIELPFGVDVERFKPSPEKVYERDCLIYVKRRKHHEVERVKSICETLKISYSVITYGSYKEEDLIHLSNTSRFGILLDCHESQGFAVQELMALNLPLVVWDAVDMFVEGYHEYRGRYKLKSTSVTSWDESCGVIVDETSVESGIRHMVEHYRDYAPRDFVVRELSPAACMQRWVDLLGEN